MNTSNHVQIAPSQTLFEESGPFHNDRGTISAEAAREDLTNSEIPLLDLASLTQLTSKAGTSSLEVLHESCPDPSLRPLISMLHLASNNLLARIHTSGASELFLQNKGLGLLKTLLSARSPATKAIARTFLPAAIESSNVEIVPLLLDTGIDSNFSLDYLGEKCLILASGLGNIEIIRTLLEHGADYNTTKGQGSSHPNISTGSGAAAPPLWGERQSSRLE